MLSYKMYKMINESFHNLGLAQKQSLGLMGSNIQEMGFEKKKPVMGDEEMDDEFGDEEMGDEFGDEEMGDEFGDEEMGDFPPDEGLEDELGGEMGMESPGGDMDDMEAPEGEMGGDMEPCFVCNPEGEDMGPDPECGACGGEGWLPAEEAGDEADPLMGGDDMGDQMGDDMGGEDIMMMKKPMRKHMSGRVMHKDLEDEDNDSSYYSGGYDDDDETPEGLEMDPHGKPLAHRNVYQDRNYMHKKGACCNKNMTKEDVDFVNSVMGQIKGDFSKHSSGLDDSVLKSMRKPKAGDAGFAPQGRVGEMGGGYSMDDIDLPTLGN